MKKIIIASFLLTLATSSFAGTCKAKPSEGMEQICLQSHELMYLASGLMVSCGAVEETTFEDNHYQLSSESSLAVRNAAISGNDVAGFTRIMCATKN